MFESLFGIEPTTRQVAMLFPNLEHPVRHSTDYLRLVLFCSHKSFAIFYKKFKDVPTFKNLVNYATIVRHKFIQDKITTVGHFL